MMKDEEFTLSQHLAKIAISAPTYADFVCAFDLIASMTQEEFQYSDDFCEVLGNYKDLANYALNFYEGEDSIRHYYSQAARSWSRANAWDKKHVAENLQWALKQ